MNTKIMLITLFSIIVIAGILFVNNQVSQSNPDSPFCNELDMQIDKMHGEANNCDVDSDCVILGDTRACGCWIFANKNTDMDPIASKIEEFRNKCEPDDPRDFKMCEQCYTIRPQDELICKENKCILEIAGFT